MCKVTQSAVSVSCPWSLISCSLAALWPVVSVAVSLVDDLSSAILKDDVEVLFLSFMLQKRLEFGLTITRWIVVLWRSLLAYTWIKLTIYPVLSGFQSPNCTHVLLQPFSTHSWLTQRRPCCLHPSGTPTHLSLSRPFCWSRTYLQRLLQEVTSQDESFMADMLS